MPLKTALCVGINHFAPPPYGGGAPSSLRGCVNDALLIGQMLRVAGFDPVRQLHNESAKQEAILERLNSQIARLRAGDTFVFWISTHGTQVQDRNGDELLDGKDEAICPHDHDFRNPFVDDKFAQILSRANPEANIFLAFDSCHSHTMDKEWDLQLGTRPEIKPEPDGRVARFWAPPADISFRSGTLEVSLDRYLAGVDNPATPDLKARKIGMGGKIDQELNHLVLAGCQSDQSSWDCEFAQGPHGAMTYGFAMAVLKAWKQKQAITYAQAFQEACAFIAERNFEQNPQLDGPQAMKDAVVFGREF